ncbi:MAG: hypothetical protein VYA67_21975 [Actinomycetota bacterium]|nr:hypothetical protein [Actinomycetota bacterium]
MRNVFTGTLAVVALTTTSVTTGGGAVTSSAIDLGAFGNNFRDALIQVYSGTLADGTYAVTVQECDTSNGSYSAVDASRLLGSLPAFAASDDTTVKSFGVRPTKRYVQVVITPTGATTGGPFTALAVLGNGSNNPAARS